jgi:hypothetical protein
MKELEGKSSTASKDNDAIVLTICTKSPIDIARYFERLLYSLFNTSSFLIALLLDMLKINDHSNTNYRYYKYILSEYMERYPCC